MESHIITDNLFELFSDLFKNHQNIQGYDRGEFKFVRVEEKTSIFLNSTSKWFFFF